MTEPGLIVIGSGPAGVGAAEAFRTHNSTLPVRLISADPALPYERPPLSKDFLRGETDDVALHPRSWFAERNIELVQGVELDRIDPGDGIAVIDGVRYSYTALVLATGATPAPLPVAGGEQALQLRSLSDAQRLRTAGSNAQTAVVVGAGFIGCEAAASLARRGVSVTLVAPQDVPQEKRLGKDAGEQLLRLVKDAGVHYVGGVSVDAIHDGSVVQLDSGMSIECDLVLAATGVVPNSGAAEAAGLDIEQSRVVVGADMVTSAPNIFAAGDVALAHNRRRAVGLRPNTGRMLPIRARSRVPLPQALMPSGTASRASGRASATATSSTTHGATATSRAGCCCTTTASRCGTSAPASRSGCSRSTPTMTTTSASA